MKISIDLGFELFMHAIAIQIKKGLLTLEEVEARLLKKERPLLEQGPVEN